MNLEQIVTDHEQRLRTMEVDMGVVKEQVTNHLPTAIQDVRDDVKGVKGDVKWVTRFTLGAGLTTVLTLLGVIFGLLHGR